MPIYEYRCTQCGHEFDELQKVDDAPLVDCPECSKAALVKLVSAPSFRLKGSGWYETDFKKDKRKNLADDGKSGDSGAGDGTAGDKPKSPDKTADSGAKKDAPAKSEPASPKQSAGASGK